MPHINRSQIPDEGQHRRSPACPIPSTRISKEGFTPQGLTTPHGEHMGYLWRGVALKDFGQGIPVWLKGRIEQTTRPQTNPGVLLWNLQTCERVPVPRSGDICGYLIIVFLGHLRAPDPKVRHRYQSVGIANSLIVIIGHRSTKFSLMSHSYISLQLLVVGIRQSVDPQPPRQKHYRTHEQPHTLSSICR